MQFYKNGVKMRKVTHKGNKKQLIKVAGANCFELDESQVD